jgi:hypothetical protein
MIMNNSVSDSVNVGVTFPGDDSVSDSVNVGVTFPGDDVKVYS